MAGTDGPSIEDGVRETLRRLGVEEPKTAPELISILLAQRLDKGVDDRSLGAISAQLRQALEDVNTQPREQENKSGIDKLIDG